MYEYLGSTDIKMYDVFTIYISSLALLIYNLMQVKTKQYLLSKASNEIILRIENKSSYDHQRVCFVFAIAETVLISLYQHGLVSILNRFLGNLTGTGANYFGLIFGMPILLPFLCWVIGVDPFKQIDLIVPAYPLALFFMKLGCFCAGCCYGIPADIYLFGSDPVFDKIPMQLVEAGVALLLFFFLLFYKNKAKEGTLFPIYVVLYSGIRFFTEFFRGESSLIGCFKIYHFLCIIGFILGIAMLFIVLKYKKPIYRFFAEKNFLATLINKEYLSE